jgi:hypothetical protein
MIRAIITSHQDYEHRLKQKKSREGCRDGGQEGVVALGIYVEQKGSLKKGKADEKKD